MGAESLLKNNFEDYLKNEDDIKLRFQIPENIEDLNNIIIYGPEGTGKYTKALKIIKKYSPSSLKYNKKILIPNNKNDYYIKISDIHYEVDLKLLGCNSKTLWNDIYTNIVDIVNHSSQCQGIILCKNMYGIILLVNWNLYTVCMRSWARSRVDCVIATCSRPKISGSSNLGKSLM